MRIHTLGTSHGDSTFCRFNSSTAYETDSGVIYLVDAGAPVEALMRRQGLCIRDLRAVFLTHMHDDHAGGLSALIKETIKYPRGRLFPLTLHFPEEKAIPALKSWLFALHENADSEWLEYKTVDDGVLYDDDELTVTAIRTRHLRTLGRQKGDPCSFAYVLFFKKENKTVLHTGDLCKDFSDFPKIAAEREFDICLCEATHYDPADAIEPLKRARFKRLLFIHIASRWHTYEYVHWDFDHGEKKLLSEFSSLPYPVQVAHDGGELLL